MPANDLAKRAARKFMGSGWPEADREEGVEKATGALLIDWLLVMDDPSHPDHEEVANELIRRARRRGLIAA